MDYAAMRSLIVLVRVSREESARVCAAMLSLLDKDEKAGKPVPGYVALLDRARAQTGECYHGITVSAPGKMERCVECGALLDSLSTDAPSPGAPVDRRQA